MKKIYYGWYVAIAAAIIVAVSVGIVCQCLSIFIVPISESLQKPRASVSVIVSLGTFGYAIIALLWGKLCARIQMHKMMIAASVGMPICFVCMSLARNIWLLYVLTGLASVCQTLMSVLPFTTILSRWFYKKRGLVLGMMSAGIGLGGTLFNFIGGQVIASSGWPAAFRVYAVFQACILIPLVVFVVRTDPSDKGLLPYGSGSPQDTPKESGERIGQQGKVRLTIWFWITWIVIMLTAGSLGGGMNCLSPWLQDLGYSTVFSANVLSIYLGLNAIFTILIGIIIDRIGIRIVNSAMILAGILGFICMMFAEHMPMLIGITVFVGIAMTFGHIAIPFIVSEVCGKGDITEAFGIASSATSVGSIIAPIAFNGMFDRYGTYLPAFRLILVILAVSFVVTQIIYLKTSHRKEKTA